MSVHSDTNYAAESQGVVQPDSSHPTTNDVFDTIGQQVQKLELKGNDRHETGEGGTDEPEEYRWIGDKVVEKIESLCMNCQQNGETRMLLTKIPFFRETIIMSFSCSHCGHSDTSIQNAGEIQEKGSKYLFTLHHPDDLERSIIKSDEAIFRIEELDIEMPAGSGQTTNIEGLLTKILRDLESGQKDRKDDFPDVFEKIDAITQRLIEMMIGRGMPFTVALNDPSGNSWIEPSAKDIETKGKYSRSEYPRTAEQNAALGLGQSSDGKANVDSKVETNAHMVPQVQAEDGDPLVDVDLYKDAVYSIESSCPGCMKQAWINLQSVNVPHFKEVILSSLNCEYCGYRTNDVKTGGEVPEFGKRITLHVKDSKDLSRDLLKSENCTLLVPECRVEIAPGTMGGRFTTVEGILTQMRDDLQRDIFDTDRPKEEAGDSMSSEKRHEWEDFFTTLNNAISGKMAFTLIMSDPLDNSYIQSLQAPDPDPKLVIEQYMRSEEELEELGLAEMKTKLNEETGEYEQET